MQILFIANGSIGDVIMSTGVIKHLVDTYPNADFTIAAGPASAPLLTAFPNLKRLIVIEKKSLSMHWLKLWNDVRREKWDLVVDMRSSLISYVLRAKQREVFYLPDKTKPKIEQMSAMFGIPFLPTYLWVSDKDMEKAKALLPHPKFIVIAPMSNSCYKDWSIFKFAELAEKLAKKPTFASSAVVVLALKHQRNMITPLLKALPSSRMVDLIGETDLPTACAIIKQAQLFIGNDSGLLHIAGALQTPLVGLYGPNNDKEYAPRGPHVRVAKVREFEPGEKEMRGSHIIDQLTVKQVEAVIDDFFPSAKALTV